MLYADIGRREQGKTTLAVYMSKRRPARLIFDPRRMVRRPESTVTETSLQCADAVDTLVDARDGEVVYSPREDDVQSAFDKFSRIVKEVCVQAPTMPLAVVVDEVSFIDLNTPAFQWVLRCSLRDVTHIILTSHRPVDVPTNVRAIVDHWLLFACRQEHDLKVIESRCSLDVARAVQTLRPREFIHWDDERGIAQHHRQPGQWYIALNPPRDPSPALLDVAGEPITARASLPLLTE